MSKILPLLSGCILVCAFVSRPTAAQEESRLALSVTRLEATPSSVVLSKGEAVRFAVTAYDVRGNVVNVPIRIGGVFSGVRFKNGRLRGVTPGEYQIVATVGLGRRSASPTPAEFNDWWVNEQRPGS